MRETLRRRRWLSWLPAALLLACLGGDVLAQGPALWGDLEPGAYRVGFAVTNERDYSRSYWPKNLRPRLRDRARPVQVSVWYPARVGAGSAPEPFATYVHLLATEYEFGAQTAEERRESERYFLAGARARGVPEGRLRALLGAGTAAYKDAPPLPGSFPLLVVGQGLNFESPITHAVLCEYLASHGYVVATAPLRGTYSPLANHDPVDLETEVRDMEFVISRARAFPNADPDRLGLVGFDLGGMAALLLQMRNTDVDALASLDSGIAYEHNTRLLKQSPHYDPLKLRVPLMHATATKEEVEARGVREDASLFESSPYADTYRLRVRGMRHVDFTSYSMVERVAPGFSGPADGRARAAYEALCRYALNFLNAFVKGDRAALAFVKRKAEATAADAFFTVEIREARPAPPTEDQFVNLILTEGPGQAARTYREVRAKHPGHVLFREATLNRLGYQFLYRRADAKAAVQIFLLNVEAFPQSWNAYDSLAEAYLAAGERESAVRNYRKSLELNPRNENAAEALKKLGQR